MTEPGETSPITWPRKRIVVALIGFAVLLLVSLFALRSCRETQPRPRVSPWTVQ